MREPVAQLDGFELRRLSASGARACVDRLCAIFRDAVLATGPARYSAEQVAAWAGTADDGDRWAAWATDGAVWIAASRDAPDRPVAYALRHPADHLDHLYVDPVFQRRGLGRALLAAVADEARESDIASLSADASLIAYPVFVAAGYHVVEWQEVERRGQTFSRARMRTVLA